MGENYINKGDANDYLRQVRKKKRPALEKEKATEHRGYCCAASASSMLELFSLCFEYDVYNVYQLTATCESTPFR